MVRESQKQARNKWDAENMKVVGCKIRKDQAEAFRALCIARNTTPNEVLRKAILSFMGEGEAENS